MKAERLRSGCDSPIIATTQHEAPLNRMIRLSANPTIRFVYSGLICLALAAACAAVWNVSPRGLHRLELNAGGMAKEVQCAWSRWIAKRDGVIVISRGDPNQRAIALTFDDGPHPRTCTAILDVLRQENVHATFFPVGFRLQQNPDLLDRMIAEGHEVGNHTWDHQRLNAISPEKARLEVRSVRRFVYMHTGIIPTLVRPPGGSYDARVLEIIRDEGGAVCLWTANAGDWKKMTATEIADKVLEQIHPGSIVLMHDEFMQTPQALPRIIRELRARGFRFVTASEMMGDPPPPFQTPVLPPHWNIAQIGDEGVTG
jgi:peptidoglycan/xylan/chitin deacetylase (PgdA/CDA1 family)